MKLSSEGLTLAEIALRLGTTLGAVKSQAHKIRVRAKAATLNDFEESPARLTVPIGAARAVRSGADELQQVLSDRGRLRQMFLRSSGVSGNADVLADESPEVWRERGQLLRVIAASNSPERVVVRIGAERLRAGRAAEVVRQGKVLRRTLDDDGGEVFVSISRSLLGALTGATA